MSPDIVHRTNPKTMRVSKDTDALDRDCTSYEENFCEVEQGRINGAMLDQDEARYDDVEVDEQSLENMRGLRSIEREILFLRAKGMSQKEISELLGVCQATVSNCLVRCRLKLKWLNHYKHVWTIGEIEAALKDFNHRRRARSSSHLTIVDLAHIVSKTLSGTSQNKLAKEYGMVHGCMRGIIHRLSSHLVDSCPSLGRELKGLLELARHQILGSPEYVKHRRPDENI